MTRTAEEDLVRRTEALLEPGEIDLAGVVVRTAFGSDEEARMHAASVEVGEVVAEHADGAGDTYVYSGNDDPEFAANQHQGLTIEGDEFVWECQQLLREGTFDLVFYYEASADHEAILADLRDRGYDVTGVTV